MDISVRPTLHSASWIIEIPLVFWYWTILNKFYCHMFLNLSEIASVLEIEIIPRYLLNNHLKYSGLSITIFNITLLINFIYTLCVIIEINKKNLLTNFHRIWHSEDRASWYFLIIKPKRSTNSSNLFLQYDSTCFGQYLCPLPGV
jgi:hypothetical protein